MINKETVTKIARYMGFDFLADVSESANLKTLLKDSLPESALTSPKLSGIYMYFTADNQCYIGQSVDIDRRYKEHMRAWNIEIRYIAIKLTQKHLRDLERAFTQKALKANLRLMNTQNVPLESVNPAQEKPLYEVFDPEVLHAFATNDLSKSSGINSLWAQLVKKVPDAQNKNWEAFKTVPQYEKILSLLGLFVKAVIPFPEETANRYWTAFVTKSPSRPVIASLSSYLGNIISLSYYKRIEELYWLELTLNPFLFEVLGLTLEDCEHYYPWIQWHFPADYTPAPVTPFHNEEPDLKVAYQRLSQRGLPEETELTHEAAQTAQKNAYLEHPALIDHRESFIDLTSTQIAQHAWSNPYGYAPPKRLARVSMSLEALPSFLEEPFFRRVLASSTLMNMTSDSRFPLTSNRLAMFKILETLNLTPTNL